MDFRKVGKKDKLDPAKAKLTVGIKKVISMLMQATPSAGRTLTS